MIIVKIGRKIMAVIKERPINRSAEKYGSI